MNLRFERLDGLRALVAGSKAVAARYAARALFDAGGQKVLPAGVRRAMRTTIEREASRVLAAVGVADRVLEAGAAPAVAVQGVRAASRQVLRSVGAAAAGGALIDGSWALVTSVSRVRAGEMTGRQAAMVVAREAGSGAAATAAGTAAAAAVVALTGGIATPAVFVVAAVASMGAKAGLDAWIARVHAAEAEGSYARLGASHRSTSDSDDPFRRA